MNFPIWSLDVTRTDCTLWSGSRNAKNTKPHQNSSSATDEGKGQKWAMLTAYDMYTAAIFEEVGIPVLLVGDSASNNVFGNEDLSSRHCG